MSDQQSESAAKEETAELATEEEHTNEVCRAEFERTKRSRRHHPTDASFLPRVSRLLPLDYAGDMTLNESPWIHQPLVKCAILQSLDCGYRD